jgi:hypothetical protein
MTKLTPRQKLDNLEAAIVEDILAMSDDELLAELKENGEDPEEYARRGHEIINDVLATTPEPFDITDARNPILVTGNAWWAPMNNIALPPHAEHRVIRGDNCIVQTSPIWVGQKGFER